MINVLLHQHHDGRQIAAPITVEEISDCLADEEQLLWVDVTDPSPHDLARLGEEFGFHPLALEDVARPHQRPKLDHYEGFLFIVFYALELDHGRPISREIDFFVGPNYVVSAHHGRLAVLRETADRWNANVQRGQAQTVGFLVYSLLDTIVDGYFPVIDAIAERIDDLEDAIFARQDQDTQATIFGLKKDLLGVRRIVAPGRDVLNTLVRRDAPVFGDEAVVVYFQDVYDHVLRVTDAIDTYRDILSSALDANLSMVSHRLNEVVKRLTSFSIILMSSTLIAGIYGMNFDYMPELHWLLGYPFAVGLMVLVGGSLALMFKRIDWL